MPAEGSNVAPSYARASTGEWYNIGGSPVHTHAYLKQIVQADPPAGDINTRWIDSDTGVEYRWDTGSSVWLQIGSSITAHNQLTGLAADDHTQYAPIQVINAGDTPSTAYQRTGSLVVRRNVDTGTGLGFLPLQGGTMTGALNLYGAPSSALHAATKAYVDTKMANLTLYGPYTVTSPSIAVGAEGSIAYSHSLGVTPTLVIAELEDGNWASCLSWRVLRTTPSVTFLLYNGGNTNNSAAYAAIRFLLVV